MTTLHLRQPILANIRIEVAGTPESVARSIEYARKQGAYFTEFKRAGKPFYIETFDIVGVG